MADILYVSLEALVAVAMFAVSAVMFGGGLFMLIRALIIHAKSL